MSLIDKIKKNSKIKSASIISESKVYNSSGNEIVTNIPMINVALSGDLEGGFEPGLLTIAGPSKHFKSGFALILAAAFQQKYDDGVVLFYDSEFGTPENYFKSFGVDMDRVVHIPIMNIEELKFDIIQQLEGFEENDNVLILVDSIGNLASKKEVEDAIDEKSVADMTRAKALKSLFRMVTPYLKIKKIPMVVVNHTYKEIGLFPKDVVSGGTGLYYSSSDVWILGRRQDKEQNEIKGYNFIINVDKSRKVKEGSKIPIHVTFENGIEKYSGLFDVALEGGFIEKASQGWYQIGEKKYRQKEIMNNSEFWESLLGSESFKKYISDKYKLENFE